MMLLVVGVLTIYVCLRDATLSLPWSWQSMALLKEGKLRMTQRNGAVSDYTTLPDSWITGWICVIRIIKSNQTRLLLGRVRVVILLPDNVPVAPYRRLRTALRWQFDGNRQGENQESTEVESIS